MHSTNYGAPADTHHHHHHHQQQQQGYTTVSDCCFPPDFPFSSPQNLNNHPYHASSIPPPPPPPHLQQPQHHRTNKQFRPGPSSLFLQQHHQLFHPVQQFRPFPSAEQGQKTSGRQISPQQDPNDDPPLFAVDFKLGLHGSGSGGEKVDVLNREGGQVTSFVHGSEHSPPPPPSATRRWHPQEDSATITKPFWQPLDGFNEKQCRGSEEQVAQGSDNLRCHKPLQAQSENLVSKCLVFNELEAIYSIGKFSETYKTGSGSALTGENSPTNAAGVSMPFSAAHVQTLGGTGANANTVTGVDHGSENSIGEEASVRKRPRRKRKRGTNEKWGSIAQFLENMVKQILEHQERCHREFLEVIERIDRKRREREEAWRREEIVKYNREALARTHEQGLASIREAQIVSYLEKITGQSVNLPAREVPSSIIPVERQEQSCNVLTPSKMDNSNRWPKAEVEALIHVRSMVEKKFQEPGFKRPLWEEVSCLMSSMGYQRSAKRCKEKWENINKYFRKAKDGSKKRALQSKTCSYFNQLDEIYTTTTKSPSGISEAGVLKQDHTEFAETILAGREPPITTNSSSENLQNHAVSSLVSDFDTS